jgi:hypothetical protein
LNLERDILVFLKPLLFSNVSTCTATPRDDRKSWLQSRLQKAGLSKETAAAMADGRVSDAMKGGKLSVEVGGCVQVAE